MKPTRRPVLTASRLASASLLACLALAACVPAPRQTPAPAPRPAAPIATPTPAPAPAPVPAPLFSGSWMDAPLTPGDWTYAAGTAQFGQPGSRPHLTLRCDRAAGAVEITRAGSTAGPLIVRAETAERSISTVAATGGVAARIPARDPLLDAMAFSKGRFAVEIAGTPTLYVPSYPEVTRVIEDCR